MERHRTRGEAETMSSAEIINFDVDGKEAAAYLVRPEGDPGGRAVIVVHEWWGLNEHTKDIARRLGDAGFFALAPDLYDGAIAKTAQEASQRMHDLEPQSAIAILNTAVQGLADVEGVDADRIGVTGFCMGGTYALLLGLPQSDDSGRGSVLRRHSVGRGPRKPRGADPLCRRREGQLDQRSEDRRPPRESRRLGKRFEIKVYEDADHAFFNDTRPEVYDAVAASDAWTRVTAFLRANL